MIFITNFTNSRSLSDIKGLYDDYHGTNINFLLDDFVKGNTYWTVSSNAAPGDIVVFMCAKEARNNLGMATSHIPAGYSDDFRDFVDGQKKLYKKYSGHILGYGVVSSVAEKDGDWWMADVDKLVQLDNPVSIDDFRSFISINRLNSITHLKDDQWERLKWVINQKNTGIFPDAVSPDVEILEKEFEDAVKKEMQRPIEELKKSAQKKSSQPSQSTVQTKVYHREAVIAAYVKKRANGHCQLCGKLAPFKGQDGEPYLECHHIEWLSKGGMDSIDNCVALCPNCHRKMHVINDPEDIDYLRNKNQ